MSDLLSLTNSPNYWSREQMVLHGKHAVPQSVWDYLACVDAKLSERGHTCQNLCLNSSTASVRRH